jgi:hypothetical protein
MNGESGGGACQYGNAHSPTTIALFGDSHALAWFPALARVAVEEGWRLVDVTMSTCSPASIPVYVRTWQRVSNECANWREAALQRLVTLRATIVIVTGSRWFQTTDPSGSTLLTGPARSAAWSAGMATTLGRLVPATRRVIVLADTPSSAVDPPACLSQHRSSVLACATSVDTAINSTWVETERAAADAAGAGFIDPDPWVCPTSPCPATLGNLLIYRDPSHLTSTYAAALAPTLRAALLADLAAAGVTVS